LLSATFADLVQTVREVPAGLLFVEFFERSCPHLFRSIGCVLLVARGLADSLQERPDSLSSADGQRVEDRPSVIEGAVLEVRGLFSDGPP
jgi:hypothetical protein